LRRPERGLSIARVIKPGDRVDRYLVEDPLGEGGMGRVFRAYDERLDRRVALKVLMKADDGGDARARLLREARAAAKLDHPNVVAVHDVGEIDATPWIAMELVQGRSLREVIADRSTSATEKTRILIEVGRALGAAHAAGLVHRDIKPENVLVRTDGRVKVLDFGIARRARGASDASAPTDASLATLTADGVKVGTPMYMAPEQIRGESIDGRADQFAWGVLAVELFTGKTPWDGADALALIASIMTEKPEPLDASTGATTELARVVYRALEKRPDDRFASMEELLETLGDAGVSAAALPGPARGSAPPPSSGPAAWAPTSFGPAVRMSPLPDEPPTPSIIPIPLSFSRRYSGKEITDVFDRALAGQPRQLTFEEVAACARGMGLDEGTIRHTMTELSRRGAVEPSAAERSRSMMGVKRQAAIWGVFVAFFFLLNLFDHGSNWWFQYPSVCWGLWVGIAYVRAMFPTGKRATERGRGDPALEFDSHRLTQMMMASVPGPPRLRVDPAFAAAAPYPPAGAARIAVTPSTPPPSRTPGPSTEELQAAELEAAAAEVPKARR
jgi:serine/threonine-protein kinase